MKRPALQKRFDELNTELEAVDASTRATDLLGTTRDYVDNQLYEKWRTKVTAFFQQLSTAGAPQFLESFEAASKGYMVGTTNREILQRLASVFLAAKEDCENGWLVPIQALLRAEVFDDELEQAEELRGKGYLIPAAVIGRVVLEGALRQLCDRHNVPHGKLARMNDDLKKAGAFDKIVHKQVDALSAVGNAAAHGNGTLSPEDVADMLRGVRRFLESNSP